MKTVILLDMDGVLCRFVEHALMTHGREGTQITTWDIESHIGLSVEEFRKPIIESGAAWWRGIPEMPWWRELFELAKRESDEVYIATSPALFSAAPIGKAEWLRDRLGAEYDDLVFTKHKHLLAGPGRILVDDSEENVTKFSHHGGHGILFPAAWNYLGEMNDPVSYVEEEIKKVKNKIARKERSDRDAGVLHWSYP